MKAILLALSLLLLAVGADAQTLVVVDSGATETVPGIGGNAEIGYAFAKGDVVTIDAKASKKLEKMVVYRYPGEVLGRVKFSKAPKLTFTMPEDGIVVFDFVSDRDGTNKIAYRVTRMPASEAVQHYSTKVTWQKPNGRGTLIPRRVEGD